MTALSCSRRIGNPKAIFGPLRRLPPGTRPVNDVVRRGGPCGWAGSDSGVGRQNSVEGGRAESSGRGADRRARPGIGGRGSASGAMALIRKAGRTIDGGVHNAAVHRMRGDGPGGARTDYHWGGAGRRVVDGETLRIRQDAFRRGAHGIADPRANRRFRASPAPCGASDQAGRRRRAGPAWCRCRIRHVDDDAARVHVSAGGRVRTGQRAVRGKPFIPQ